MGCQCKALRRQLRRARRGIISLHATMDANIEGYSARYRKKPREANPYPDWPAPAAERALPRNVGDARWPAWDCGWHDADRDIELNALRRQVRKLERDLEGTVKRDDLLRGH